MVAICVSLNLLNLFDNIDTYSNMDRQWSPQSQNSDNFSPIGTNSSMPPMQYGFDQQSSMDYLQQVQLQFAQEMQMQQQQQQHHLAPQRYGLFLGDLSSFCRDTDIREEFQVFGEIAEIRVKHGKDNAKALCYGFIEFTTLEAAMEAMKTMNGRLLKGRPLRSYRKIFRSFP